MGKVVGGGSSVNVMVWSRGHKNDFDYWAAEAGDDAWNYAHVLDVAFSDCGAKSMALQLYVDHLLVSHACLCQHLLQQCLQKSIRFSRVSPPDPAQRNT
jgi:GMC oxidoreductase